VAVCATAGAVAACGGVPVPPTLGPQPVAYGDTLPIVEPRSRDPIETTRLLDAAVVGEFGRLFSLRRWVGSEQEALNVTRFDDVVSSSWFERRNGYRPFSPQDVARGATTGDPPGPLDTGPLTVIEAKTRGRTPGFRVRDAAGQEFLFKFDPVGFLHLTTAAEVISSRFAYAAGFNTPENTIVIFDGNRLVLDPSAGISRIELVRLLSPLDRLPDGRFLAVASKILPGVAKGPFYFEGRRVDDPNDYYHHEYRRELRGLHVVAAWLNHVDLRFSNTYDAFVPPGYIRHYLIDFGGSLGSGTVRPQSPQAGREHNFDLAPTLARLASLGFLRVPWQSSPRRFIHPSLGWMPVEAYAPGLWKPKWPNEAFFRLTLRDGYWGAKLVGAFTDPQIEAAVSEGRFTDQAAADTLVKILEYRRDRTIAYWYSRVTPIEHVRVEPEGAPRGRRAPEGESFVLDFDDVGIRDGLARPWRTEYRWTFDDAARGLSARGTRSASSSGGASQSVDVVLGAAAGAVRSGKGGRASAASVATMTVSVARHDVITGRPARLQLAWRPDLGHYEVIGLEH